MAFGAGGHGLFDASMFSSMLSSMLLFLVWAGDLVGRRWCKLGYGAGALRCLLIAGRWGPERPMYNMRCYDRG